MAKVKSPSPKISGLANRATDLLRVLERELAAADLEALPNGNLRQLLDLLTHWSIVVGFAYDRRATKRLLAQRPGVFHRRQAG
jgi:hypothetical protein